MKADMLASYPPHMRDARTQGIPTQGIGAVYPFDVERLLVEPFPIPAWWPRAYGLDVGWHCTAAIWGAMKVEEDCLYLVSEHYQGMQIPALHAEAIKARGAWQYGAIDPASHGGSQLDGETLIAAYREHGLNLVEADNAVDAGVYACWERMETGRLKVFSTMPNWKNEFRRYHRHRIKTETSERVVIAKKDDHAMDAMRYLVMTFAQIARTRQVPGGRSSGVATVGDRKAGY